MTIALDPDVQRVMPGGPRAAGAVTDLALVSWMTQLATVGGLGASWAWLRAWSRSGAAATLSTSAGWGSLFARWNRAAP